MPFEKIMRKFERHFFGKDPSYQDPYEDLAEQFYARIYLKYLFEAIDREFRHQQVRILDVGCHTGRLAIPLARAGHFVKGIDPSRFHIKRARGHAREAGVRAEFFSGDGFRYANRVPEGSFDFVLCTEVLYQRPDWIEDLRCLVRALRSGGLLATSHRTRFYYLAKAIREKDWKTAEEALRHSEGELCGSYFNWQTPEELQSIYRELELDPFLVRPIGVFSGSGGDGMAGLSDLTTSSPADREAFFDLEAGDLEEFVALGRYLLVIGKKR